MRIPAAIALAVIASALPAFAATEPCRFIQAKADREACYQRQEVARKEKQVKPEASAKVDQSIERMKIEDDRLSRQLRSICRGC